MVRKQLEGLLSGMERKLDSWPGRLPLKAKGSCSQWEWFLQNRTSFHPGPSPLRTEDLSEESQLGVKCRLLPQGEDRSQDIPLPPQSSHIYKQPLRRLRIIVAILEGVGLRDLLENTKCQAGGQTLFKCFKMQITTGFKFSLPPLVKTKVEAGLPKSHKADSLFFWGLAQAHQLRKGLELMAPSQTD